MLTSTLGIRLVLWIGPTVPLPAPAELLQQLTRVVVTNDGNTRSPDEDAASDRGRDGFELTFALSRQGLADPLLITRTLLAPRSRVVIAVAFGLVPEVLIDGIITLSQFEPGPGPGEARLTITGRDLTALLALEERNETYPNQPDFVIVNRILTRPEYIPYGLVPTTTPSAGIPIMLERIPTQRETDLACIERLAGQNGYTFHIEPVTFGVNRASWGPVVRAGLPQRALSVDLGAATNVRSINFANDALAPVGTRGVFVEPITRTSIPIPALPSLRVPPLALIPAAALRQTLQRDTASRNPGDAAVAALADTMTSPDAVTAQGELDATRYGSALRARRLVGLRGVGLSHDGLWYVRRVTHEIVPRGTYTQRFELGREGVVTTTPAVLP
jgi:hypothetical protein